MKESRYRVAWMDAPEFSLHINRAEVEAPIRLDTIRETFIRQGLDSRIERRLPHPVPAARHTAVHKESYIQSIRGACQSSGKLTFDTAVIPASWNAAILGAGAVVDAVEFVLDQPGRRAFCSTRPPGHHAFADSAGGFCLFNNVAIGAEAALTHSTIERVAILDWDVHHGDGTQDIFYEREDVFFASIHQSRIYPGTGCHTETGAGPGAGTTLNCPMPEGATNAALVNAWKEKIRPALESFQPDILFISAGFDADSRDPLGGLEVSPAGFEVLSESVLRWSEAHCNGRVVSTLEGGYNPTALAEDVSIHVNTLLG